MFSRPPHTLQQKDSRGRAGGRAPGPKAEGMLAAEGTGVGGLHWRRLRWTDTPTWRQGADNRGRHPCSSNKQVRRQSRKDEQSKWVTQGREKETRSDNLKPCSSGQGRALRPHRRTQHDVEGPQDTNEQLDTKQKSRNSVTHARRETREMPGHTRAAARCLRSRRSKCRRWAAGSTQNPAQQSPDSHQLAGPSSAKYTTAQNRLQTQHKPHRKKRRMRPRTTQPHLAHGMLTKVIATL